MTHRPMDSMDPEFDRTYMQGHPDAHLLNEWPCPVDGCLLADGHAGTHRTTPTAEELDNESHHGSARPLDNTLGGPPHPDADYPERWI